MIIKSHIRGGFRDAAAYLKDQGKNKYTRLVEMSDPHVKNLDEAFRAMWAVSDGTKVKKSLHHVSINPMKDERLTDKQVRRICKRLEEKYGYAHGEHQRVIVEHIKDGRQHFHVMWNRVNLKTGKPHYPYMHKKQSKIAAREMEIELGLGLKKPVSRRKAPKLRIRIPNSVIAIGHDFVQKGSPLLYAAVPVTMSVARRNNSGVLVAPIPPVIFDVRQSGNLNMLARLQFEANLITGKVVATCSIKGVAMPAPIDISALTPQWVSLAAETVMICSHPISRYR